MKLKYLMFILILILFTGCSKTILIDDSSSLVLGGFHQDEEDFTSIIITLMTLDTYYQIFPLNQSSLSLGDSFIVYNESTGSILVPEGYYQVYLGMSFSTSKTGVIHCDVFQDDLETELKFERSINNINQVGNANTFSYIQVRDTSELDVRCKSSAGNVNLDINDLNFNIKRIN